MPTVEYRPENALIIGVDDYRPYVVIVDDRAYRFPDEYQAESFAKQYA